MGERSQVRCSSWAAKFCFSWTPAFSGGNMLSLQIMFMQAESWLWEPLKSKIVITKTTIFCNGDDGDSCGTMEANDFFIL